MEAFADAIGLWMAYLRLCMLNFIQSQIQLVIMRLLTAAELYTTVGQDSDRRHTLFGKERQDSVVQQARCRDQRLGCLELGGSPLRGRDAYVPNEHHFQPGFLDFARHHGFIAELCRPYRSKTKGKVELPILLPAL